MVPRSVVIGAEVVAVPPALEVRYMVRKKKTSEGYRMTTEEERCWRYLLQWPLATAEEVARETGIPAATVQYNIDRIGTPRGVFEAEAKAKSALDTQVGGSHYKDMAIQPWQAMEAWLTADEYRGYHKGVAIAYLARERDKGGLDDIKKAIHHLQRLVEIEDGRRDT
jgi:hypothetical protein